MTRLSLSHFSGSMEQPRVTGQPLYLWAMAALPVWCGWPCDAACSLSINIHYAKCWTLGWMVLSLRGEETLRERLVERMWSQKEGCDRMWTKEREQTLWCQWEVKGGRDERKCERVGGWHRGGWSQNWQGSVTFSCEDKSFRKINKGAKERQGDTAASAAEILQPFLKPIWGPAWFPASFAFWLVCSASALLSK